VSVKYDLVRDLTHAPYGAPDARHHYKICDTLLDGPRLGELNGWNASSFRIAILSITDNPARDAGPRTVALVDRVLRSTHRFSGLRQILPDGESIHGTWQRWIDDPSSIDIILIIDESADDAEYMPPSLTCAFTDTANAAFAEMIHDKALGLIGIVDLRAALRLAR
jgi:hypothetical protein